MSYNFRYVSGRAIEFTMSDEDKEKLVAVATIDKLDMQLISAEIEISVNNQIKLTKRYQCRYPPHKREMRYATKPGAIDNNKEILDEIALIDEQL